MRASETARLRALAFAIATAPGLGTFATVVSVAGLEGAIRICETRDASPRLLMLWEQLGHRLAQLPTREEIEMVIIGAEVARRMEVERGNVEPGETARPMRVLVEGLCTPQEAMKGLRMMESYGARIIPPSCARDTTAI